MLLNRDGTGRLFMPAQSYEKIEHASKIVYTRSYNNSIQVVSIINYNILWGPDTYILKIDLESIGGGG